MSHQSHRTAPSGTCSNAAGDPSARSHEAARRESPALLLSTAVVLWLFVVVVFVLFPLAEDSTDLATPLAALHIRDCIPERHWLTEAIEKMRLGTFVCRHNPSTGLLGMTVEHAVELEGTRGEVSVVEALKQGSPGSFDGVNPYSFKLLATRWRTLMNITGVRGTTNAYLVFTSVTMGDQPSEQKMNYVVVPIVDWKFAAAAMWCICALMCIGTLGEIRIAFDTMLLCRDGRAQLFELTSTAVWHSCAKVLFTVFAMMMSVSVAAYSSSIATAIADERIDWAVAASFRSVKARSSVLCVVLLVCNAKFLVYSPRICFLKCATVLWMIAYVYFVVNF